MRFAPLLGATAGPFFFATAALAAAAAEDAVCADELEYVLAGRAVALGVGVFERVST